MASPAATGGGVELSIQMPAGAHASDAAGDESQLRESADVPPPPAADGAADDGEPSSEPEKELNFFVRVLATEELVGNALGTLASLWATFNL
nr:unnamed protein product [Digitaria exilis]